MKKYIYLLFSIFYLLAIYAQPLCAAQASAVRDSAINETISSLGNSQQPAELAPIRVKMQQVAQSDEFAIARAVYLYNQRRFAEAKGDLKEIAIENPNNPIARAYIGRIDSAFDSRQKTKKELEEEIKGIASVEQAQLGGNYGKEEFGDTDGNEKFTTNTFLSTAKVNQKGDDLRNYHVSEGLRMEGSLNDFKYTATANINYYNQNSRREDWRLVNATWWMQNDKLRFILGDTSSYLSRYVLNGVNYRGVNINMNLYESMFGDIKDKMTFLYGKVPYFWQTEDEYIYPRDIMALRNEIDISNWWELNTSFAYIWDNDTRVKKINVNNNGKKNGIFGIDQIFRIIPGVWTFTNETAFSYDNESIEEDIDSINGWATYWVSDIKTKTLKVYNSYERIEPEFRSYVGLTGFTANKQVTIDREHILNFLDYTPYEEVDLGLQYSRTRTNLDKKDDVQTIMDSNYKANLKIMPKNALPEFSLRGSIWTSNCEPGPVGSPQSESSWDAIFAMSKTLWETDWTTSYGIKGYSQYINDTHSYGDALEHSFSLGASKRYFDRITLTPSYTLSRATLKKEPNRPISTDSVFSHMLDVSFSSILWDTANLTIDYNLSRTQDFATPSLWGTNNAFTTTFSWPFTTMLGRNKKFVLSPYLAYHYSAGSATLLDRRYFSGRVEGDYFLTQNSKFNLSGEYRDNVASDPTYNGYSDEYRVMLSFKTLAGF